MRNPSSSCVRWLPLVIAAVLAAAAVLSCSTVVPNRDPVGRSFPPVRAEALDGEAVVLPDDLAGRPAVLLVGFVQDAQFDGDRWLLGLAQVDVDAAVYEVPTLRGWVPALIAGRIDAGMRRGIPEEDWGSVVTVYADADAIVALCGNENPNNMRVIALDEDGRIVWFHDRGYSAGKLLELVRVLGAGPA